MEQALIEVGKEQGAVTISRVSALTGIRRDEVKRVLESGPLEEAKPLSVVAKVLAVWESDRKFSSRTAGPRALSYRGKTSEFHELVAKVSSHLNASTVLNELLRTNAVTKTGATVQLRESVAVDSTDRLRAYELLARDLDSLVRAVGENVDSVPGSINLHIHTEADNLFKDPLPEIREWIKNEGREFHKRIRSYLAQFDADLSQADSPSRKSGARVVVTAFSHVLEE